MKGTFQQETVGVKEIVVRDTDWPKQGIWERGFRGEMIKHRTRKSVQHIVNILYMSAIIVSTNAYEIEGNVLPGSSEFWQLCPDHA